MVVDRVFMMVAY